MMRLGLAFALALSGTPLTAAVLIQGSGTGSFTREIDPKVTHSGGLTALKFEFSQAPVAAGIFATFYEFDYSYDEVTLQDLGRGDVDFEFFIDANPSTSNRTIYYKTQMASTNCYFVQGHQNRVCQNIVHSVTFDRLLIQTAPGQTIDYRVTAAFVPQVPEPATWAMMIGGFGLLGSAVRRRRLASRADLDCFAALAKTGGRSSL
jgi:hypothetical protein